jgi:hypothetical protein
LAAAAGGGISASGDIAIKIDGVHQEHGQERRQR